MTPVPQTLPFGVPLTGGLRDARTSSSAARRLCLSARVHPPDVQQAG
jgi:hypothetical protein